MGCRYAWQVEHHLSNIFARIGSVGVFGRRQSTRIGKLEGFFDGGRDVRRWKRLVDFALLVTRLV